MSFTISEEEYKSIVRELQLEDAEGKYSVAHLRDTLKHVDERNIRITPSIGKTLFGDLKMKTFHISAVNRIDQMASLVGPNQKKPLSSFTYMSSSQLKSMGGIQTEGGIIYELIGTALFKGTSDIMSIPDQWGRRWLQYYNVIPTNLTNQFSESISNFNKFNPKPLLSDGRAITEYVARYSRLVEDFIKQHRDEIKKFVTRERGSSYNEILIQQFVVKDVLITINNVRSYGGGSEHKWLSDYLQLDQITNRRELNEPELRQWKEYNKMFRQLFDKITSFATGNITYTDDTNVALTWVKERGGMIDSAEYSKTFKDKELTENKTNKKMSKKIKISESQLKTIMERRHTYAGDTNEEEKFDIDQLEDKDKEKVKVTKPEEVKEQGEMNEYYGGDTTLSGWEDETESAVRKLSKVTIEHLNNMSDKQKSKMQFEMSHYDDNVYDFIMDQIGNVDANEIVEFAKNNEDEIGTEAQFVIFAIDDFCNVLGINDDEEEEEEYNDEEGQEEGNGEDEMMNESIKSIRENFKRFL